MKGLESLEGGFQIMTKEFLLSVLHEIEIAEDYLLEALLRLRESRTKLLKEIAENE